MAHIIAEPCVDVKDRACVNVCPVDCIHEGNDNDRMLYINPSVCTDCGACEAECPNAAIFYEDDVPSEFKRFIEFNALYFRDKLAVQAEINRLYPEKRRTVNE